jgi:hypothetical protein
MIRSQCIRGKDDLTPPGSWTGLLTAVAFAMHATVHTTTRATPSQLVFNRDAMLNVHFEADWQYIKQRKLQIITQNNKRENAKRKAHNYRVSETVKVVLDLQRKHGADRYKGPYQVTKVNDNGTVELRQNTCNGGAVFQTWNIRNILPYKD